MVSGRATQEQRENADGIVVIPSFPPSMSWPSHVATQVEAAATRLETCDEGDFETTLAEVLEEVAKLFGIAAMGECNGDPELGVKWFDPDATSLDEMVEMIPMLESGLGATGPYSIKAPSGRPGMAIPAPPDSFAHHLAILAGDEAGFTIEQTSIISLFAASVSAARRRIEALRALERQARDQAVLMSLSTLAATDDGDALQRILQTAKQEFAAGSVTVWLSDGDVLRLVESSETGENRHVERGVTVPFERGRRPLISIVVVVPFSVSSIFWRPRSWLCVNTSSRTTVPVASCQRSWVRRRFSS